MKVTTFRLIALLGMLAAAGLLIGSSTAQTTTYTGTIKDLGGNLVTAGQVTFTLAPSTDSTQAGNARFVPSTITCPITSTGTLQSQAGTACVVASNTALNPSGTSYKVCVQPNFIVPGSCFFAYATGGTVDISTVAPTLSSGPLNYGNIANFIGPGTNIPIANPAGNYDPTATYSKGDLVAYNGNTYLSLVASNLDNTPGVINTGTAGGTSTIGTSGGTVNATASAGTYIMLPTSFPSAGALTSFTATINAHSAGGVLSIYILTANSDGTFTPTDSFTVSPTATGLHTFIGGTDYTARNVGTGQMIAFESTTELLGNDNTASSPGFYYVTTTPTAEQTWTHSTVHREDFSAFVTTPASTGAQAWQLFAQGNVPVNIPYLVSGGKTLLESTTFPAGSSIPTGWTNSSGYTIATGGGLQSPSTGTAYTTEIYGVNGYDAERRTYRITFTLNASGTIFNVFTQPKPGNGDPNFGSSIIFDASANNLIIQNALTSTSGVNPGTSLTTPLTFTPATGVTYTMTINQNRRELTASVSDPITGNVVSLKSGSNATSTGYSQSQGASAGTMFDILGYRWIAGQYTVLSQKVTIDAKYPRLYIVGASIVEGLGLPLVQRWSQMVAAKTGNTVISGRSGDLSAQTLARAQSEIPVLKPDYALILLGTNDLASGGSAITTLETNVAQIVSLALSTGAKGVYVACLPPANGDAQANVNAFNAWVLTQTNFTPIRVDLAMTVGNDGVTQNTALFQADLKHPNQAGGVAIANRVFVDAPDLLDASILNNQYGDWFAAPSSFTGDVTISGTVLHYTAGILTGIN